MISLANRLVRRHGLERDLEFLETRRALLDAKLEQAKVRAAEAAAALKAAEARSLQAQDECASIRQLLAFDPDIINGLPVELLQAIWRELLFTPKLSDQPGEAAQYNSLRLLMPSRLAAVCRHWRNVALNTPELWIYIALQPYIRSPRGRDSMLDLVRLHLARSRSLALELELFHPQLHPSAWSDDFLASVLRVVTQDAYRWRFVKLRLFPPRSNLALLDDLLLRRPTPKMEELHLIGSRDETLEAPWLSGASSLKALSTHRLKFQPPTTLRLSAIVSAHIDVYMDDLDHLWSALSALPSVQSLSLTKTYTRLGTFTPPTTMVTLPLLECLKLRGGEGYFPAYASVLVPALSAPRLRKLSIRPDTVAEGAEWGPTFFAAFPTIVDVEFVGDDRYIWDAFHKSAVWFSSERVEALNCLRRLKSVSFTKCWFPISLFLALDRYGDSPTPSNVTDFCSDWICRPPTYLWPELESFQIRWADPQPDKSDQTLGELLSFVRTRTVFCSMHGKQFNFALLDWPAPSIPSWFREAIGCLLGPAHVRLTTADGAVHAPVADDGEEEEPEAQFTDSGEGSESHSDSEDSSSDNECAADEEWWVAGSDGSQSS